METFDLLDCRGEKTGEVIARDEAHRTGAWHGAFHCLITYEREGRGCVLFQKRSLAKKIAPGKFDVSVGGHYSAGEGPELAGPREIREELGLDVPFSRLVSVGRRVFVYCFTPGIREYEFQDVFLLPVASWPEPISLQREEVDAVFEMDVEEGIGLFSGRVSTVAGRQFAASGRWEQRTVSHADFVPCIDNYYLKFLLLARRYLHGERNALAI